MIFNWDGTHLGKFDKKIILDERQIEKDTYWQVSIEEEEVTVLVRNIKDALPCLIDEMKSCFGLPKLGTHHLNIGAKLYAIIRVPIKDGNIVREVKLNEISENPGVISNELFRKQVQEVFAFRELFGLSQNFESSIRVREPSNGAFYPISYSETSTCLEKEKSVLPKTVLEKWFQETTLSDVIKRMVGFRINREESDDEELSVVLSSYRWKLDAIINRINREYVWLTHYIMIRIENALI